MQNRRRNPIWRLALIVALAAGAALGTARADTAQFDAANKLYETGNFAGARDAYLQLIKAGPLSANLYYNLGNAEWRLGDSGEAAVDYERALALEPSHAEARANLEFVREQTGAKVPAAAWWQTALNGLNAGAASMLLSVCGWVAMFCVALLLLRPAGRTAPAVTLAFCLLTGAYAAGCLWQAAAFATRAVVIAKSVQARVAPVEVAPLADVLPAGSEVLAPEERGAWTYCTIPDGTRAWVPTEALEPVRKS